MPKANLVQTNFTAGEISPKLLGRVDVEKYKNAVELMNNMFPQIQGGIKSAPLLRYVAETKDSSKASRLIKFEFSSTEANILEFGDQYIRFYNQDRTQVLDGASPYEISTVFLEAELFEIEYIGGADTIFLFHENHPVQRLRRFANDNWAIDDAPFDVEPFLEQGFDPNVALTLSAATVGAGRTFTAAGAAFLDADVGRRITYQGGTALITGYTSTTIVTCTIEVAFESTSVPAGWIINGSPQAILNPSSAGTVGESITLTLSTGTIYGDRYSISSIVTDAVPTPNEIDVTTTVDSGIDSGDLCRIQGCIPIEYNGTYEAIGDSGSTFTIYVLPVPGAATTLGSAQLVTTSTSTNGFRSTDVGSYIEINGGLVEITGYTNATQVSGTVLQALTSDAGAQAGAWILKSSIWNSTNGYPRSGCFIQQRLCVGGSPAYPHTLAFSRTGEYLNFELGVNDSDSFLLELDATEYDPILHVVQLKKTVAALTSGPEYTLTGGVENPISPTNTQVDNPSDYGCNSVRPVRLGNELLYMNRSGKKLRAMGYRFDNDSFASPDLTKLSEHITGNGIVDMAYQQESESILWMCREDGEAVTLCIDRDENVSAWCRQKYNGGADLIESVETIPGESGDDDVWIIVKRTVNGSIVRYVEAYDRTVEYSLESAISGTSVGGQATWTGLDHLEGETVYIIADGVVMDTETVSSGSITLDRTANEVYIGKFTPGYVKTLNPEFFTQLGSAQGRQIRKGRITLRVLNTRAVLIDGQYVDFRTFGSGLLDQAPPVYTGDVDIGSLGWSTNQYLTIQQANPLPLHVLAVITEVSSN